MDTLAAIKWDSVFSNGSGLVAILGFIGGIIYLLLRVAVERLTSPLKESLDGLNGSIEILNSTIERNNKDLSALRSDVDKIQRHDINHEDRISAIEKERNQS